MRILFAVLFSLISPLASAQSSMFAGYDSFCGLPVIVEATSSHAVATIRQNTRVIIVDPSVMVNWRMSRMFALAHECGHHLLGHLSPSELFSREHMNATPRQEMNADCWAVNALARTGHYSEIDRAIRDMDMDGPLMNGPYPPGTTRAAYMRECAGMKPAETSLASDPGEGTVTEVDDPDEDATAECLSEMNRKCMKSCQNQFGNSYSVCKNRMCSSPLQKYVNNYKCTGKK